MKSIIKGSFYKKHLDKINGKEIRFYKERNHMIEYYGLDKDLVNIVFDNWETNVIPKLNIDPGDYDPDYIYEKEMLDSFEEFKTELIYDGYDIFASIIKLHHFYSFFSPFYYPNF